MFAKVKDKKSKKSHHQSIKKDPEKSSSEGASQEMDQGDLNSVPAEDSEKVDSEEQSQEKLLLTGNKPPDTKPAKNSKPTNSKEPHSSPDEIILEYLNEQYRPYSVNDIVQNLHGVVGKAQADRSLAALVKDDKIVNKVIGRISISMTSKIELSKEETKIDFDEKFQAVGKEIDSLSKRVEELNERTKILKSELDDESLQFLISETESDIESLKRKLEQSSKSKSLSKESIDSVKEIEAKITKEYEKRLKIHKLLIGIISEHTDPLKFLNMLGLENPEEVEF